MFLNTLLLRQGLPKHPVYLAHTAWRQNSLCYLGVVILLIFLLRAISLLRAGITGVCATTPGWTSVFKQGIASGNSFVRLLSLFSILIISDYLIALGFLYIS